jgi:hypothetical protein
MINDYISVLSLVWVIYLFLFTEADRQVTELLNRIKYSLSINEKGHFDQPQFIAKQPMGVHEIIQLGRFIDQTHSHAKFINKFANKYDQIEKAKIFLISNLFLLTADILISYFIQIMNFIDLQRIVLTIHISVSLIFSVVFYFYVSKLANVKLLEFKKIDEI